MKYVIIKNNHKHFKQFSFIVICFYIINILKDVDYVTTL